ncbi:hypothetical protein WICPIJ_004930 [Wickerhamomyces pijperi]|uniref:Ubiquitin carboxyl-terminal hydrolase n=1 Tax=Wickerhamomyces pijperi TaxID=599730 RepID=A0A9P8TMB1_WICPI|nr:hypothetical protein WICPIJ_004930 [Wickerhamomyces pijperi]
MSLKKSVGSPDKLKLDPSSMILDSPSASKPSSIFNGGFEHSSSSQHNSSDMSFRVTSTEDEESTNIVEEFPHFRFGDGSDKVFGFENLGNTCYCNSILQCLYHTDTFREEILKYGGIPGYEEGKKRRLCMPGAKPHITTVLPPSAFASTNGNTLNNSNNDAEQQQKKSGGFVRRTSSFFGRKSNNTPAPAEEEEPQQPSQAAQELTLSSIPTMRPQPTSIVVGKTEDLNSGPDLRKKAALIQGPVVNVDHSLHSYGEHESLLTALKDLFEAVVENEAKTGIVSPVNFIEILKKQNELFSSAMHQDAHEFLNYLLNDIIEKTTLIESTREGKNDGNTFQDLFKGISTSQTKCLTCENITSRDEIFLDLSIDLKSHETIEFCFQQFSEMEILTGGNKFHCDECHSLQEAEKKLGIKKLPKLLALNLKRFKYSEEHQHNVKLFTKIKYPLYLPLSNDFEPLEQKFYELHGIVIHIGGGPHHGHYVSLVKTSQFQWLLFDDETVEKVSESFVLKYITDVPDLATPYVLFYQEISKESFDANKEMLAKASVSKLTAGMKLGTSSLSSSLNNSKVNLQAPLNESAIEEDENDTFPIQTTPSRPQTYSMATSIPKQPQRAYIPTYGEHQPSPSQDGHHDPSSYSKEFNPQSLIPPSQTYSSSVVSNSTINTNRSGSVNGNGSGIAFWRSKYSNSNADSTNQNIADSFNTSSSMAISMNSSIGPTDHSGNNEATNRNRSTSVTTTGSSSAKRKNRLSISGWGFGKSRSDK